MVPEWKEECGWGAAGEFEGVHLKGLIGSSVRILESHALKRDASLCARTGSGACDVEEYLQRIGAAVNGELNADLCRQYLAFYHNARTRGRQCTEREFRSFLAVFQEMLRIIGK